MLRFDRALARAALRAALVWGLLLLPWPGLAETLTGTFTRIANAVAAPLSLRTPTPDALERLGGTPDEHGPLSLTFQTASLDGWWVVVLVRNTETGATAHDALSLRTNVYAPIAVFCALTLGAPMAVRRRAWWRSVALGGGLCLALMAAIVVLPIVRLLSGHHVRALPIPGGLGPWLHTAYTVSVEATYGIVIALWAIARWATLGRDWLWLREPSCSTGHASATSRGSACAED